MEWVILTALKLVSGEFELAISDLDRDGSGDKELD